MATQPAIIPRLGKSTLSMFLRTNCDRELYFSLYKSNRQVDLVAHGMPAPLSARPNIELVTSAGVEFETHEMDMLLGEMGAAHVRCNRNKAGKFDDVEIALALSGVPAPSFILQPALDPTPFRQDLLTQDFGLSSAAEAAVPELSGLRPDIIIVRPRGTLKWEVLPSGKRRLLQATDTRLALSVVDIKNTLEGNKSYAAEVVLYSIFLAKWLAKSIFAAQFFVSDECFLWTHNEKSALTGLPAGATLATKVDALIASLEPVEFAVIAPSVIKFFKEDIPRVVSIAGGAGWQATDFHVGPKCSNCDWLGFDRWLSVTDKTLLAANPTWYCKPSASSCDHLSQIPNVSRGARQVLEAQGVTTVTALSTTPSTAPALSAHSLLKRERSQLAQKAQAILSNVPSADLTAALSGLAKDVQLEIAISVNFDSAAGLLTGIAARATLFMPFGSTPPIRHLADFAAPVENQTPASEWDVLFAFLSTLEQAVLDAKKHLGGVAPRTQLYFWEHRQFQELCASVGRHLPKVFAPVKRGARGSLIQALAWLFPPEELVERDGAVSPHIIFVGDLAQRVLRIPTPHAFTLLSTHEHYQLPSLPPRRLDAYFVDPMGNGIPRERIFEVWKNMGTIRRGATVVTKAQAQADYMQALKAHTLAIASITARLRQDFKANLKGSVKQLTPTTFRGATGVAFDSKLWIQWADVEVATARAERQVEFTLPAEALEASYKALVLETRLRTIAPNRAVYRVRLESKDAKLDDTGEYFAVASVGNPGLPLETPLSLGLPASPRYVKYSRTGKPINTYMMPVYSLVRARIHTFDRNMLEAEVELLPRSSMYGDVVTDLINSGHLPIAGGLFLMDGMPYDDSATTVAILKAIGSPRSAISDPRAARAMGMNTPQAGGTGPDGPAARVLWTGSAMATAKARTPVQAKQLAARARALAGGMLDASQEVAIEELSQQQLSLVWGPPGTGKTSTLTAYLMAVIEEAIAMGRPRKILLTGPNYRAVEVLLHKLLDALNRQPALACQLFMAYSRSRAVAPLPTPAAGHLVANAVSLGDSAGIAALQAAYQSAAVGVFAISAHTIPSLVEAITGDTSPLVNAFDLVVIDESSQVPVTLALKPLAALSANAELVVAGDPMQMPPVQSLAPPTGAEHLVGSIHAYLTERFAIAQQRLLVNYRSADHLVDFARTLGYDQRLSARTPNRRLQLICAPSSIALPAGLPTSSAWDALIDPAKVIATLLHDDPRSSQANAAEAKMVASLVYTLRHCVASSLAPSGGGQLSHFNDDDFIREGIGVVTPHKAQRSLVLSELSNLFPGVSRDLLQKSVDTVERFQGGERHTIIVSFGVGDVDVIQGEEEFLLQMERTNVAISRAMAKCIVIMPKSLAYHLPNDSKVAQTATALKSYVEEFCSNRTLFKLGGENLEVRWH